VGVRKTWPDPENPTNRYRKNLGNDINPSTKEKSAWAPPTDQSSIINKKKESYQNSRGTTLQSNGSFGPVYTEGRTTKYIH